MQRAAPWAASATLVISFLALSLAGIYTVRQQRDVNSKICESTVDNRRAVRATWTAAERFILMGQRTEEEKESTRQFFSVVLNEIPPMECVDRKPVEVQR